MDAPGGLHSYGSQSAAIATRLAVPVHQVGVLLGGELR